MYSLLVDRGHGSRSLRGRSWQDHVLRRSQESPGTCTGRGDGTGVGVVPVSVLDRGTVVKTPYGSGPVILGRGP